MRYFIALFVLCCFLASCGPTINPALQKKIEYMYQANKSSKSISSISGTFTKPMPLAVGQWVMFGTNNDGKKSISKTSIVGKEGDAWIIETYSLNESEETATQMCVSGIDKITKPEDMDNIDILWVKSMDANGRPVKTEGPALSIFKGIYRRMLTNMSFTIEGYKDGGSVTVPAGTFPATAKITAETTFLGSKYVSTSWMHPQVPINAMVKSVSDDNKMVMELLDYGTSGATSQF